MSTANTLDDAFRFAPGTEAGGILRLSSAASTALPRTSGCASVRSGARRFWTAPEAWLREQRSRLSRSTSVAEPIDYMLKRWNRFVRFHTRRQFVD